WWNVVLRELARRAETPMNEDARRRLIEKAIGILDQDSMLLTVSVDEFFDGNTDEASIGVNLLPEDHIGLAGFRRVLSEINQRTDVQGIFLELTEIPDPDDEADKGIWPTACVAFVVTSARLNEVSEWVEALHPRDVSEGWCVDSGVMTPI